MKKSVINKTGNSNFFLNIRKRSSFRKVNPKALYEKSVILIRRRPLTSFFLALLLLFVFIALGNILTPKPAVPKKEEVIKEVQIYKIDDTPKVTLQAKVEKSGVIKITSLVPGVVQTINFKEGDIVEKGTILVNVSSNYQGGNAASLSRQLSAVQYTNVKETFDTQKEVIRLQKEIAHKTDSNADELRNITNQSIQETRDLITLTESITNSLNDNEKELRENNTNGVNDTLILQTQQQRSAAQAGLNQLRTALRQSELQAPADKTAAQLSDLQKDITLKQLDLQERSLNLSLQTSGIQLQIAQVTEAQFFPAAPFAAKIQRVHIKEGQAVNPGTVLITISAVEDPITAIVNVPRDLATSISTLVPSKINLGKIQLSLTPTFVSTEATEGNLYSIIYTIPDGYISEVADGGHITAEVPIGLSQTSTETPFIPLDSVFQSGNTSYVFVENNGKAESRKIELGDVFGRFVEVKSGLKAKDRVIINRNVLAGDKVKVL